MFAEWRRRTGQLPTEGSNAQAPPQAVSGTKSLDALKRSVAKVNLARQAIALASKESELAAKKRQVRCHEGSMAAERSLMEGHERAASSGVPEELDRAKEHAQSLGDEAIPGNPDDALKWAKNLVQSPTAVSVVASKHFKLYDVDSSGFLEWSEIPALSKTLSSALAVAEPSDAELRSAFKDADSNRDCRLSQQEFVGFFQQFLQASLNRVEAKVRSGESDLIAQMRKEMEEELSRMRMELELAKADAAEARANQMAAIANHTEELGMMQQYVKTLEDERSAMEERSRAEANRFEEMLTKEELERQEKESQLIKLRAELDAAQKGAMSVEELKKQLEEKSRQHDEGMKLQREEADRLMQMLESEDAMREESEKELADMKEQLARVQQEGQAHAADLQRAIERKNAEHEQIMLAQQEALNKKLEEERRVRVDELDVMRKQLVHAQKGSNAADELRLRLEEKEAEHTAKLKAQHDALNKKLEEERLAAERERDRLRQEVAAAQAAGAADTEVLQARLLEKEAEHESALLAHQQETERLRLLLVKEEEERAQSEQGLEVLRKQLARAREEGSSNVEHLQKQLEEKVLDYRGQMQAQQDVLTKQLDEERQARVREMDTLREQLAAAHLEGAARADALQQELNQKTSLLMAAQQQGAATEELQRQFDEQVQELEIAQQQTASLTAELQRQLDEKSAQHRAILQAQQEAASAQIAETRKTADQERELLEQQLRATTEQARMSELEKQRLREQLQKDLDAQRAEYEATLRNQQEELQRELAAAQAKLEEDLRREQETQERIEAEVAAVEAKEQAAILEARKQRRIGLDQDLARAAALLKQTAKAGDRVMAFWAGEAQPTEYPATVSTANSITGEITVEWGDGGSTHCTLKVGRATKIIEDGGGQAAVRCVYAGVSRQVLVGQWEQRTGGEHSVFVDMEGKILYCPTNPPGMAYFIEKTPDAIILNMDVSQSSQFFVLEERTVMPEQVTWVHNTTGERWIWTRI